MRGSSDSNGVGASTDTGGTVPTIGTLTDSVTDAASPRIQELREKYGKKARRVVTLEEDEVKYEEMCDEDYSELMDEQHRQLRYMRWLRNLRWSNHPPENNTIPFRFPPLPATATTTHRLPFAFSFQALGWNGEAAQPEHRAHGPGHSVPFGAGQREPRSA